MRNIVSRFGILGLLGLAAAGGCAEPSPSTFGADFEASMCRWATRCNVFDTERQCRDALVWEELGRFEYLSQSAADGRVAFDADAAGRCLNQIEELGCEAATLDAVVFQNGLRAAPAVCRDVYVGKVRNYDPCLASEECAGDNSLCGYPPMCTDACCVGSCRDLGAPPKVGEACTGTCEADAYCALDPNTFVFTVCEARRKVGEGCDGASDSCAEGLYCDASSLRCTERRKSGQNCQNAPCALGLNCYLLDGEARCRTLPDEGEACSVDNYPECARIDNFCDVGTGTCTKYPAPGEACFEGSCVPYAECEFSAGEALCAARAGLGEACGEILGPDGNYGYISCIGHLGCGESGRCEEPATPETCELPE